MQCCPNCFCDEIAIAAIFDTQQTDVGICDICGEHSEKLVSVSPESELSSFFDQMLSVFNITKQINSQNTFESLREAFYTTWNVLQDATRPRFDQFIKEMFPEDGRVDALLQARVRIAPERGSKEIRDFAFFGDRSWDDFTEDIKHRSRYHATIENKEAMGNLFNSLTRYIDPSDQVWYRARNVNDLDRKPQFEDLCEPEPKKAGEGRMSPRGVRCLYIADSAETAIAEVRASMHDEVGVLALRPRRTLRILDLSKIDRISPFTPEVNPAELASNHRNLNDMKEDLTKPMRESDDTIDYIPTQFIADYARALGFDGIGYESVLHENTSGKPGYNIASFLGVKDAFDKVSIDVKRITKVQRQIIQVASV